MGGFDTSEQAQGNTQWSSGETRSDENAYNWSRNTASQDALNQAAQNATSQTSLYGGQTPFLQQLWGQGAHLAGAGANNQLAGQAQGAWLQALGGGINPGVGAVIANASQEMGLDFSRNTLPGIRQGAVGTGNLGGSRQGIAEGLAAGELARNQSNMATTLYTQALDQASRERTAALSMSGQMQGLPWQGLESFARVVGGPIMESYGRSQGSSFGTSGGSSFGESVGQRTSGTYGQQTSGGMGFGNRDAFGMNVLGKGGTAGTGSA